MVILGFDPGGKKKFGWCVARSAQGLLQLCTSDIASHAEEAVSAALKKAADFGKVEAAGIDSPLFWVADGDRKADKAVRDSMRKLGAKKVAGTVQQVNSLRGACLSQGILAAHILRRNLPGIRITESHPKALLWLLQIANRGRPVREVGISHFAHLIKFGSPQMCDHERDATLGAVAAMAMMDGWKGWRDLRCDETNVSVPVPPVEYWMPVGGGECFQ